eukprot:7966384-Pyramimonas_sp.AAC.1
MAMAHPEDDVRLSGRLFPSRGRRSTWAACSTSCRRWRPSRAAATTCRGRSKKSARQKAEGRRSGGSACWKRWKHRGGDQEAPSSST